MRDDLFVEEAEGRIVGTAIINRVQVDAYAEVKWLYPALDEQVMVLHTLVIDPDEKGKGYGREFVAFYEAGIVPCVFNGLAGVELVMLEKKL